MEDRTKQPAWFVPSTSGPSAPKLKLYNSLTRSKTEFTPMVSNKISWYSCGPTVYDASHMGHARNYVTIDINRRILSDYFGYHIFFVQNVTDIDDKIIVRARQSYLFDEYAKNVGSSVTDDVVAKVTKSAVNYAEKNLPLFDASLASHFASPDTISKYKSAINIPEETAKNPKFPMHLTAVETAHNAIVNRGSLSADKFLEDSKSVLVITLDQDEGASVTDPAVFRELAAFWENEFDKDMASLNVLPPSVTTRVSEYVPEIVDFIQKIIQNKFAYSTADGSVYFDTIGFEAGGHDYAKLQPWNKGHQDLIDEGEGSLSTKLEGKKSKNDFALWKASKPGEPSWESPWGFGRPGWHIECSVMASAILGPQIDVHSGGIDLAFPHHDNELAQAEACHGNQQWVNYFLHTGHLHIEGQKMSKSLKNFITIREALERYTPRQLRLSFAMQQWNNQFDFKSSLFEVKAFESTLTNFFNNVRALARDIQHARAPKKADVAEISLYESLSQAQTSVHEAFCDNLSTPIALQALNELVQKANAYINGQKPGELRIEVLIEVATWITKILEILGFNVSTDRLGWGSSRPSNESGQTIEDIALPYVQILAKFRDFVRAKAIARVPHGEFLATTDSLRDKELLDLGVLLDDRADGQHALIKFLDEAEKDELLRQREDKIRKDQEKQAKKLEQARLEAERLAERLEKAKISPQEMFKSLPEYTNFDDSGLPTADKEGNPLTKSLLKKLQKQQAAQKKLHDEYITSLQKK
ncbi:cysteine--tRNA ligase [Sugiyamaella lignohabitans]|uniref:cysteine--tRNA ligase n=1 Tax=Sugiyamaella lignohabitans TaxID=796027 RepID=A0A161HKG7_9ASCO|nr:cysteine--tRNA ligase [Sugiyamaella lignohabitans]ANB13487.1 cysteine--tRNA ligase [Sugiyamaella lignohabitans]